VHTVRFVSLVLVLSGCGSDAPNAADMAGEPLDAGKGTAARDAGASTRAEDAGKGAPHSDAGKSAAVDAGPPVTFSELYAELFPTKTNARCNFCHSMPASDKSNGNLGMGDTKDAAYAALMGKTSSSSQCAGMPLLTPGEPDKSLFLLKFSEPALCGARMPLGGAQLSGVQLARIRSWIASGAKND
jgi:hypothetical protein